MICGVFDFVLIFISINLLADSSSLSLSHFVCFMLFFVSGGSRNTIYFRLCCTPHFHINNYLYNELPVSIVNVHNVCGSDN